MQIDVKKQIGTQEVEDCMWCILYTELRAVNIFISRYDYECLKRDGFFIRDGKSIDSANVLNTSKVYELKGGTDGKS